MVLYKHGIEYQKAHIGDDRRPDIIASYVLCISAAWLFVILRFLARRRTKTPMKLEDTMICIALVRRFGLMGSTFKWFLIDEYAPALGSCQHVFDCFFPRYFRSKLSIQHLRKGAHGGNRNPLWLGKTFYPDERPNWLCKGKLTVFDMLARFQKPPLTITARTPLQPKSSSSPP